MSTWIIYFRHIPPEMYFAPSYCIANQSIGGIEAENADDALKSFREKYDPQWHCKVDSVELSQFQAKAAGGEG